MTDTPEYLAVGNAAALAGIPERTLRYWIASGKLPATTGKRGKLLRLADVERVAALAGRAAATPTPQPAANGIAADLAGEVAATDAARRQLEAIRDEWLLPLVEQIREQAERIGQLQAERDALAARLEALQATQTTQDRSGGPEPASHDLGGLAGDSDATADTAAPWWRFWRRW